MDNLQLSQGGCFNLVSAALAAHAGNINLVIAVGTNGHIIDGTFVTRAAAASQAWTVANEPGASPNGAFTGSTKAGLNSSGASVNGSARIYGLYMNAAGTLTVKPGPIVQKADLASGQAALHYPAPIRGHVCFGAVRIDITANTTFVPGVTALNAAGVTPTYINLFSLPGEPLLS